MYTKIMHRSNNRNKTVYITRFSHLLHNNNNYNHHHHCHIYRNPRTCYTKGGGDRVLHSKGIITVASTSQQIKVKPV